MKWLSDVQRNGFVANNSHMSTDRPKPASRDIIRPNVITVYAEVTFNVAHLKQQKCEK